MSRDEALSLLSEYALVVSEYTIDFIGEADRAIMLEASGMPGRFPKDGSEAKAMRWLGYIQGISVAYGFYTLEEVKQHSMRRSL